MINAHAIHQPLRKGDHIRAADGGEYTVCYWFLDGVGVVPGLLDLSGTDDNELPKPKAMLREPYSGADIPCIGAMVELIE